MQLQLQNLEKVSGEKGGKGSDAGGRVARRRAGRRTTTPAAGAGPADVVFNSDGTIAFCQL